MRVRDIDMPFLSIVNFLVKLAFAAIPALVIIVAITLGLIVAIPKIVGALVGR